MAAQCGYWKNINTEENNGRIKRPDKKYKNCERIMAEYF